MTPDGGRPLPSRRYPTSGPPMVPHVRNLWLPLLAAALTGCAVRSPGPAHTTAFAPPLAGSAYPVTSPASCGPAPGAPSIDAAVLALASNDFGERSRAADALLARGEAALPALGAAGDAPIAAHGVVPVSTTRAVIAEILSTSDLSRLRSVHLASAAPAVRRGAAEELGRRSAFEAVPELLARAEDDDLSVRTAAVASLRRLTNRMYDLDATDPPATRAASVGRWRVWWDREGRAVVAERTRRSG